MRLDIFYTVFTNTCGQIQKLDQLVLEYHKTKIKVTTLANQKQWKTSQLTNQSSRYVLDTYSWCQAQQNA